MLLSKSCTPHTNEAQPTFEKCQEKEKAPKKALRKVLKKTLVILRSRNAIPSGRVLMHQEL